MVDDVVVVSGAGVVAGTLLLVSTDVFVEGDDSEPPPHPTMKHDTPARATLQKRRMNTEAAMRTSDTRSAFHTPFTCHVHHVRSVPLSQ